MARRASAPPAAPLELSVVVPTRNEADNIPLLLQRLRRALAEVAFEVIFVDDSDDLTPQVLREMASSDRRVRYLHRPPAARGGGLATAVVEGMARARGRLLCVMDGDLQHPPEIIPELLRAESEGAEVVVASRYMPGGSRSGLGGGVRKLVSRAATLVARALFTEARASSDPLAGFFLCRASLVDGIQFRPVGFKILLELLVCSGAARVVDVPLAFQPRGAGRSKASARQGLLYLRHLWSLVRDVPGSARRWKFAAIGVGGLFIFLALLELGGTLLGWPALAAWGVAFSASFIWNFLMNLKVTFGDARRERYPLMRRYVEAALVAGGTQLIVFLGLLGTNLPLILDGLLGAVAGMAVNAGLNFQIVRSRRRPSAGPLGLEPLVNRLLRVGRADFAAVLDRELKPVLLTGGDSYQVSSGVRNLCRRADATGMPGLLTEPASKRPQARSSVEMTSAMVFPLETPAPAGLKLVLLRRSRHAFSGADLEAVMRQLRRSGGGINSPLPASEPVIRARVAR
jgi:dolichol-phosphate mannosyltransferase